MPSQVVVQKRITRISLLLFISRKKMAPSNLISLFFFSKNYTSKKVFFSKFLGNVSIKIAKEHSNKLECDARLVRKSPSYLYPWISKRVGKYNGPSQNKGIAFDRWIGPFLYWI